MSNTTVEECERKHKGIWRLLTVIVTFCGLLIILVGWSLIASQAATVQSRDVQGQLNVHAATQNGTLEKIDYRLDRIDKSLEKVVESIESNH